MSELDDAQWAEANRDELTGTAYGDDADLAYLPLSPRQAEALSSLLETWPVGRRVTPIEDPDVAQALREVRDKLDTLREG